MSTLKSVMAELKAKGSDKTWAIYEQHRIPAGRSFELSAAELKAIAKTIKGIRLW